MALVKIVIKLSSLLLILISVIEVLSSCGRKEDFTKLFVEQMQTHGGKLANTKDLPSISTSVSLQSDSNGFQFVLHSSTFAVVENMVTNALGVSGETGDQKTGASSRYRLFKASSIGAGLLMRETKDGVQLNCVKGQAPWPY